MKRHLFISILLVASLFVVLPATVSADQTVSPADDIQAAVDFAAANGGTVFFAEGDYDVNIVIDAPARSFTLRGAGIEESNLYAATDGAVIKVVNTGTSVVTIEGFCILEGTGDTSDWGDPYGGGIYSNHANLVVTGCKFQNNTADYGGGMYCYYAEATVTDCTFVDNTADYGGGSMYCSYAEATVTDCTFVDNTAADYGGGMYNHYGSMSVSDSIFTGNNATNYGGGMYNYNSTADVVGCTFEDNYADYYGGGMENEYSTVTVASSRFVNNVSNNAGGMYNYYSDVVVTNSVFTGNNATGDCGGAVYNDEIYDHNYMRFTNCTMTGNVAVYGGAMIIDDNYYPENIAITNCILWGNSTEIVLYSERLPAVDGKPELSSDGPIVTYSNVSGGYPGEGNIDADPLFVNAPTDVSLCEDSPCIDAGTETSAEEYGYVLDDILGVRRPQRLAYDMGAYELAGVPFSPVVIQPLARTQLQSVLSLWEEIQSMLPDEPADGAAALIAQIQGHMANAAQLTNPIYATGQLTKAIAAMQQLAALLS